MPQGDDLSWYGPHRSTGLNVGMLGATLLAATIAVSILSPRDEGARRLTPVSDPDPQVPPDMAANTPPAELAASQDYIEPPEPAPTLAQQAPTVEAGSTYQQPSGPRKPRFLAAGWGMNGRNTTSWPASVTVASAASVLSEFGRIEYAVTCPSDRRTAAALFERDPPTQRRGVRVTLSKPTDRYDDLSLLSFVLDSALERAWGECVIISGIDGEPHHSVGWVSIVGRTPADGSVRELVRAERFVGGVFHTWGEIEAMEGGR